MNTFHSTIARGLRMQPMAACLALSLVAVVTTLPAAEVPTTDAEFSRDFHLGPRGRLGLLNSADPRAMARQHAGIHAAPISRSATLPVLNCDDAGPGSLRDTVAF